MLTVAAKVPALTIVWVETNITEDEMGARIQETRRRIAARTLFAWLWGLFLWTVLLLALILPPWFVYPLLLPGIVGALQRFRRTYRAFYALCNPPLTK